MSLVYKPFLLEENSDPEELEAMPEDDEENIEEDDTVIEEREGVHYVSKIVLDSNPTEDLDKDFKNLVDSLIK
jgi:hypothetical protein